MGMKGVAKIELTNVKTGEIETVEKHNLVTNAVPAVLKNDFNWMGYASHSDGTALGDTDELCPNYFGGILLYEQNIPENVEQYFAQPGNKLIGYASNYVNGGTDKMQGSLNQTESGPLESGDGYRFVFDFNTSQANGTIGAVGLTSKNGGMGPGRKGYTSRPAGILTEFQTQSNRGSIPLIMLMCYDEASDIATSAYLSGTHMITITRIQMHAHKWVLVNKYKDFYKPHIVSTNVIETEAFGTAKPSANGYYNFCYSDGYIWGFEHKGNADGNSNGNATINWIKIDVSDLSFDEGTWEINAQLFHFGNHRLEDTDFDYVRYTSCSAVLGGYLYCISYKRDRIYKINLSNITDVTFINGTISDPLSKSSYNIRYPVLGIVGGKIAGYDWWLNGDTIITGTETVPADIGNHPVFIGPKFVSYILINSYRRPDFKKCIGYMTTYLATINNLPAPVEKTADKTMKITYILREEVDEDEPEENQA